MNRTLTNEQLVKLYKFYTENTEDAIEHKDADEWTPIALEMLMDLLGIDY